jgi:hypothetical protein
VKPKVDLWLFPRLRFRLWNSKRRETFDVASTTNSISA